ncbi:PstS family phosphate ABC transporter substrate-binding protein [Bergeyella sp. RCAD1439]|uniref:PstS family phosphate ABC transporter substrate-binding protein n=1 Tax=Bergeyella anatis TaxID=3113737 RepID=UPI002E178D8D|nr:substrate-binding domain-containing protein [Bergeyella sp. RCAD1439]
MRNRWWMILCAMVFLWGCSEKKTFGKSAETDYHKGQLTITTDESFKGVAEALAGAYMISYPETEVKVEVKKEDFGFLDLLNDKTKLVVMSRKLNEAERQAYDKQVKLKFQPAYFAADAVVFIVPKTSDKTKISMAELEKELASDHRKIIFDGTNSGNLNFVAQKFGKKPSELKFSVINGNENVIEELDKFPGRIGVVSLNTFSRMYSQKAQKLKDKVRVLSVVDGGGVAYDPIQPNLQNMTYPFTRELYFLTNEGFFGIANGFMRYSCTQLGQMVVEKEGLQPYYLFKREVEMR